MDSQGIWKRQVLKIHGDPSESHPTAVAEAEPIGREIGWNKHYTRVDLHHKE